MCLSRLYRVVSADRANAVVEEAGGRRDRISLLALDGSPPDRGEWLIVHSGYAIRRVDEEEAHRVLADLDTVQGGIGSGDVGPGDAGPGDSGPGDSGPVEPGGAL